jgi:hypothetical protein
MSRQQHVYRKRTYATPKQTMRYKPLGGGRLTSTAPDGFRNTQWTPMPISDDEKQGYWEQVKTNPKNNLISWNRVVLEKLTVTHYFSHFYGSRRFVTLFTKVHHWTLFWAICIRAHIPTIYFDNIHFITVLSSTPRFHRWTLPTSRLKFYMHLCILRVLHAPKYIIFLDFINPRILGVFYTTWWYLL